MMINLGHFVLLRRSKNSLNSCKFKSSQSTAEYCLDSLKKHDYDNFICTILLKKTSRAVSLAVRSLNVEVDRVAALVSQDAIASMRFHFWEDTIEKCYTTNIKNVPKHPVAIELYKAISRRPLTKRYLKNLVLAKKNLISNRGFGSLEEMESYAEQTSSNAYYLILEGSDVKNLHSDHAASHLGKAQGLVERLRNIPQRKKMSLMNIPEELLLKHQISQEEILRGIHNKKTADCIYDIASRAHLHLTTSRGLSDKIPSEARPIFLPAIIVSAYLKRLEDLDYNIFNPRLEQRSWSIFPKLYINMLKNKY